MKRREERDEENLKARKTYNKIKKRVGSFCAHE